MSITDNLKMIKNSLPSHVTLVAVSKTKPVTDVLQAYDAGQRIFGENKVQEMVQKYEEMPKDIEWHMIGHLQRNKVKYMASFVSLIHGVDSFKLLKEIDKQASKQGRVIDCLLQVFIAEEETKFGLSQNELKQLLQSEEYRQLQNVKVIGLMGMATNTDNQEQIEKEFRGLKTLFDTLNKEGHNFSVLSMGMSGDYPLAVASGSTMVRVGSNIFGDRNYTK